ncbi:uncharacterized protein [Branchiostoma lanceolatum]|uniref:uncharacterized protein n=1 Tax=Branchiostoma lanceolatum TaxID=7740 RepID=UPI0011330DB2
MKMSGSRGTSGLISSPTRPWASCRCWRWAGSPCVRSPRHFAYYLLTRALKETGEEEKADRTVQEFQADVDSDDKIFSFSLQGYALWHTGRLQEASAAFMRAFDNERSEDLARQNFSACLVSSNLNTPGEPAAYKPTQEEILDLD